MNLEFGVFDHVDRGGRSVKEVYDLRMRLIRKYDEAGFYAYHPAEHHSTPLSCSPSPNVLMAALIQNSERIRFAPLVYVLTLYEPLRFIEEICMLDHMSGGRIELGVGKGIAPFELIGWGVNPLEAQEIYQEALEVVLRGLTAENKVLSFKGEHFKYSNVPLELEPYQKPHPPLWYGVWKDPDATVWPAQQNCNVAMLIKSASVGELTKRFTEEWHKAHDGTGKAFPKVALNRTMVVAETDQKARERAESAHNNYWRSMDHLWKRWGAASAHFPHDFEGALGAEMIIYGSPATVREQIERQAEASGINYMIGRFVFGDMPEAEIDDSLGLFVNEVMPHFQPAARAAAE